jgi:hypothetical protein
MKSLQLSAILTASLLSALNAQKRDATVTERQNQPPESVTNNTSTPKTEIESSDAGAQRPIFQKTENISAFGGLDSRYLYRNNPLSSSETLSFIETAMWINTAYLGASFEPIEIEDAVITPYAGASYTSTEYLESGLDSLGFYSTSAYVLLMTQHSSGWILRTGLSYAMDKSESTEEETYMEFYPNIGAMKIHSISESTIGIIDFSGGYHKSESDPNPFGPGTSVGELDNYDITASYSLRITYGKLIISPRYGISYKNYSKGATSVNNGREEFIHAANLKFDYSLNENLNISLFSAYSQRESSGGQLQDAGIIDYDFHSTDAGVSIGLNTTF